MTRLNGTNWRRYFVFCVCASLLGCQAAFGDYKSGAGGAIGVGGGGQGGSTANAGNGGTSSGGACDSEGIYQCTDTEIQICTSHKWQPYLACTKDLCDAQRGRCMTCAPGSHRCAAFNLQTCAASGDSWTTTQTCDTAAYCDAVSNTCLTCLTGEAFCSGASLYVCNSTQDGWDVTDCGNPDTCASDIHACAPCTDPTLVYCNGADLMQCGTDGKRKKISTCGSSQLCTQTLTDRADNPSAWSGACSPGCTPGAYDCNPTTPAVLEACPPSGLAPETIQTCTTPALCDSAQQQCDPGCGVPPGTYVCDGAKLEQCSTDGTQFTVLKTCQDASHCNTQKHDCVACNPGDHQCSGATLQKCGSDQTWQTQSTCASSALCDATKGVCNPSPCQGRQYNCNGATLQTCAADLTKWVDMTPALVCVDANHCDATSGKCITPECTVPGKYGCEGNTSEQCDGKTLTWTNKKACTAPQVCDLTLGCATCVVGDTRCNPVGGLTYLQTCKFDTTSNTNTWSYVQTCASSALCVSGDAGASCLNPVCKTSPMEYHCSGNTLQPCKADRSGWDVGSACASGTTCDAALGHCDVCTPKAFSCSGSNLMHCSDDGLQNNPTDCYSAAHCDAKNGYCTCASTDAKCSGTNQIQTCSTDGHSWNAATACTNGCQDNAGNSDYCAACPTAGEVQCVQTSSPGSTRTCPSDRSAWGATTPCTKGYGCVNNGTTDYCADACSPGTTTCVNTTSLHTCNSDGKGFTATVSQCADSTHQATCAGGVFTSTTKACATDTPDMPYCLSTTGECVQCTGSMTRCSGGSAIETCTSNNTWGAATNCPSNKSICSGNACVQCTSASTPTCTNGNGEHCDTSTHAWVPDTCTGNTPKCLNGGCVVCTNPYTPVCVTSTGSSAPNDAVQSCSSSGNLEAPSCKTDPNGPVCYQGACAPCNESTADKCDGTNRVFCTNGSVSKLNCATTANPTGTCVGGKCVGCASGAPSTCPDAHTYQSCDNNTWTPHTCPSGTPDCTGAGQCVQCAPDSGWVCTGSNTRQSCSSGQIDNETCSGSQICDPADNTCKPPTCTAGTFGCSGNELQQCNQNSTGWNNIQSCSGACYQGACVACTPGSAVCIDGTSMHVCLPDGSGYGPAQSECADVHNQKVCTGSGVLSGSSACPSNAPNCSSSTGQCIAAACTPNAYQCSSASASEMCNADGTAWNTPTACGSGQACNPASGKCEAACTPGQLKCADSVTLQICNPDGFTWTTQQTCSTNQVCNATGTGSCDCTSADNVCTASNVRQVCDTQTGLLSTVTCEGTTPACLPATDTCGCSDSAQCVTSPTVMCDTAKSICVVCLSNSDCADPTPNCDTNTGTCTA
jgi:hypothetical protein